MTVSTSPVFAVVATTWMPFVAFTSPLACTSTVSWLPSFNLNMAVPAAVAPATVPWIRVLVFVNVVVETTERPGVASAPDSVTPSVFPVDCTRARSRRGA